MVGDGELQEGQIWEAVMAAGHRKTSNLCAILDHNRLQIDGKVEDIKGEIPIVEKFRDFGWHACSTDGHDFGAILSALDGARAASDRPTFIVAETVKGKGVSFMEESVDFHGKAASDAELALALAELDGALV
jgi:transketolase